MHLQTLFNVCVYYIVLDDGIYEPPSIDFTLHLRINYSYFDYTYGKN